MVSESLRSSEHNSTLRNFERISRFKTKYLLKYVTYLKMIILNKCNCEKQNFPVVL